MWDDRDDNHEFDDLPDNLEDLFWMLDSLQEEARKYEDDDDPTEYNKIIDQYYRVEAKIEHLSI